MLLFRLWNFLIEQKKIAKKGRKKKNNRNFLQRHEVSLKGRKKKEEEIKFSSKEKRSESIHFKSRYGKNSMTLTSQSPKREEPRSPPQMRIPTEEQSASSTPPRSPSREDLASSALLSFHGILGQQPRDDLESEDEDNQVQVPPRPKFDKSNNALMLNLTQDDQMMRNQNIKKMIDANYFGYAMDGRLRRLIVDQLFHGIGKLARNEIALSLLDHMDDRTLSRISKHLFAKRQIRVLKTGENYRKRDGGYLQPAPRAKRGRMTFENDFRAAQDPSFQSSAGLHSNLITVEPQKSVQSTNFVPLNRPCYPPPSSVNSAPRSKDLGHLAPTNRQLHNNPAAFGHWSRPRNILSGRKPHSALTLKMKTDGRRSHENIAAPYNPRVSVPYATVNPFRKGTTIGTPVIPAGYNNLIPRFTPQVAMSKTGFGNNGINYNPRILSNFNQPGRPIKSYNKGGRPPSNRFKARQRESVPPQPDMFICPAPNCGKLMHAERVHIYTYFHQQKKSPNIFHPSPTYPCAHSLTTHSLTHSLTHLTTHSGPVHARQQRQELLFHLRLLWRGVFLSALSFQRQVSSLREARP